MNNTINYRTYIIPESWQLVIASDILDIRDGTHETPKYISKDGIPLITSKNLKDGKIDFTKVNLISHDDHIEISKRSGVEKGDILFAMIGTVGNPVIVRGLETFSIKNIGLFKKNREIILSRFAYYFLSSKVFEKQLHERKLQKGTTQKFIPLGNLRNIIFPLPPLAEQHRIVAKIEELFSSLDNGIQNLKTAQQQLKIYRQAVLKWAFEGKLTSAKNDNSQSQAMNDLPEGWQWVKLKNIAKKITDGEHATPRRTSEGVLLLSARNIQNGYLSLTKVDYIPEEEYQRIIKRCHPEYGDVLISCSGSVGRVSKVPKNLKFTMVRSVALVKLDRTKYLSNFFEYLFQSPQLQEQIEKGKKATAQANIFIGTIGNLNVIDCSIETQQAVVTEVESRLSVCDKPEETIQTSLKQAEILRQSILKKAFSGQLVPQNPNDEPASLLLEKIQGDRAKNNPKTRSPKAKKQLI